MKWRRILRDSWIAPVLDRPAASGVARPLSHVSATEYALGSGTVLIPAWSLAPALFFFANDRDDLVVPAIAGEGQRGLVASRCGWIPGAGVGAVLHQQPRHLEGAMQDGVVDRAMLVSIRHVHVDQLRAGAEHGPHLSSRRREPPPRGAWR